MEPSNWRSSEGLEDFLVRHGVPAITGVDTRRLTRHLRDGGRHALRLRDGADEAAAAAAAAARRATDGRDLVCRGDDRRTR